MDRLSKLSQVNLSQLTVVKDEAIRKLEPLDEKLVLCVPRKHTKPSFFGLVEKVYKLLLHHHFLI